MSRRTNLNPVNYIGDWYIVLRYVDTDGGQRDTLIAPTLSPAAAQESIVALDAGLDRHHPHCDGWHTVRRLDWSDHAEPRPFN